MLTDYIRGAMRRAHYEILHDDGSFYGAPCYATDVASTAGIAAQFWLYARRSARH